MQAQQERRTVSGELVQAPPDGGLVRHPRGPVIGGQDEHKGYNWIRWGLVLGLVGFGVWWVVKRQD